MFFFGLRNCSLLQGVCVSSFCCLTVSKPDGETASYRYQQSVVEGSKEDCQQKLLVFGGNGLHI